MFTEALAAHIAAAKGANEVEEYCVCVAVHVRPLIDIELLAGSQNCLTTVSNAPQVSPLRSSLSFYELLIRFLSATYE